MVTGGWGKWSREGLAAERKITERQEETFGADNPDAGDGFSQTCTYVKTHQTVQFNHAQFFCMSI